MQEIQSEEPHNADGRDNEPTVAGRSAPHSFLLKYEIMSATAAICGRFLFYLFFTNVTQFAFRYILNMNMYLLPF